MKARGWKKAESRMARDVGTERKPCDGSRAGADWDDGLCVYQLKVRRSIPRWLWGWLTGIQATAAAIPPAPWGARAGCLVLKHPGARDDDALVVLGWRDWCDLHGKTRKLEEYVEKTKNKQESGASKRLG